MSLNILQIRWFVFISMLIYQSMIAQNYFVAKNGNDNNPGTDSLPWLTIQKAFNSATPGSIVYVKAGIYNEKLILNVSGSAQEGYITFQNYGDDTVIIDGTGKSGDQIILIQNKSYIKLIGFELRNNLNQTFGTGIWVQGYGRNIEIRRNRIHDMKAHPTGGDAMGISIYGTHPSIPISNIIIDSNYVYNCQPGHSESLTLNGNVDTFQISNNIVHDNNNIGIDMIGGEGTCPTPSLDAVRNGICKGNIVFNCRSNYGGGYAAGIYVDGGRNIIIERNLVYQCDVGIEIGCENRGRVAYNITVRNNLIYNNDKRGLSFGGYNYPYTGLVRDCKFLNNTVFKNDKLSTGEGEIIIEYALNCTVKNNIFYSTNQSRLMTTTIGNNSGNKLDYNLWFAPGGIYNASIDYDGTIYNSFISYQSETGQDAHSLFSDPLFISPQLPTPDLHLRDSSPAINRGDPSYVPSIEELDFDGNLRMVGNCIDIGAYEKYIPKFVSPPKLLLPENATVGNPLIQNFCWSDTSDATIYHIQISLDSNFTSVILDHSDIMDTFYISPKLNALTKYYWHVRGRFESIISDWSETWNFTTTLESPYLLGAVGLSVNPTIFWTKVENAASYHLQISSDTSFTTHTINDSLIVDTLKTVIDLSDDKAFFVRVAAKDSNGKSDWSNIIYFTTAIGESLYSFQLSARWNIISVPLKVKSYLKENLYPLSASRAYTYNTQYFKQDTLQNGVGYWLKLNEKQHVILTGIPLTTDTIEVKEGWNMIGSISIPVAVLNITSIQPEIITSNFFMYKKTYQITDTLYPGYGYWVKVNQPGYLILNSNEFVGQSLSRIRIIPSSELPPGPPEYEVSNPVPERIENIPVFSTLEQNYPNPFNPLTKIKFRITETSFVTLKVFNLLGQEVASLVNEVKNPGKYEVEFDGSGLSSGVYIYSLKTNNFFAAKKFLLIR